MMKTLEESNHCPLCQQEKCCAVSSTKDCWCMNEAVPRQLIDKVVTGNKDKHCICQACIEKFKLGKEI